MTPAKNQPIPDEHPRRTLGSHLRDARTRQGKSLPEAAQATRINPATLTALETDDFTKLPAEVFTRGFVKLYAEYLGLDITETLRLYTDHANLDPERPADHHYRRDVLFGTTLASPISLLKGNPRVRIVAILLAALLGFYALGAMLKAVQKHPEQTTPENELAKSLMESNTPPLPGPPGEPPVAVELAGPGEIPGSGDQSATPTAMQPGGEPAVGAQPLPGSAPTPDIPAQTPTDRVTAAGQPSGAMPSAQPTRDSFTAGPEPQLLAQTAPPRRPARNISDFLPAAPEEAPVDKNRGGAAAGR